MSKTLHSCPVCNQATSNKRFCSIHCAGKYYSKPRYCKNCKTIIGNNSYTVKRYCDICNKTHNKNIKDWSKITILDFFNKLPIFQANARIRELARMAYKRANLSRVCKNCGYSKFIEVCHIKPIASFEKTTTINIVNHITNLIGLCPNCHWELDHGLLTLLDAGIEPAPL